MSSITIEASTPTSGNLFVPPLGKRLRGRFNPQELAVRNPDNAKHMREWPDGVPGQRLSIDTSSGECAVVEPLRIDEFKAVRKLFDKRGIDVPEDEKYESVHVPSVLHYMQDAVNSGLAVVVEGEIPKVIKGEKLKSFVTSNEPDENETLRDALKENTRVMTECVGAITKLAESISGKWGE